MISGDTSFQKMLLLIGPKRSGKGTIARVLSSLIGAASVVAPTLGSLCEPFGMAPLIGRPLAIIGDARLSSRTDQSTITERLLSVSGEDSQSVARKYLEVWSGRLGTRFMMLTNEAPRLTDASGALASRFLMLPTWTSFFGEEDRGLSRRLEQELPGILNWALEGLSRLQEEDRFTSPARAEDLAEILGECSSPVAEFLKVCCVCEPSASVSVRALFGRWGEWCTENGREHCGTVQTFGRDLIAACPQIKRVRQRESVIGLVRTYNGIRSGSTAQCTLCSNGPAHRV